MPRVSVIIPTIRRPVEVQHAIHSALNQTYRDLEVIVVIDGLDSQTEEALRSITDPRLRVLVNPENVGLAESRNVGIREAVGEWVAYLDDDDEWLPDKIEKQVAIAEKLGDYAVVVSRFIERSAGMERVWPETLPEGTDRMSEYLFCRRGMLLPSTYLATRKLMLEIPFTKGLRHIEDLDWLLRATADPRTRIGSAPEPLLIYNNFLIPGRESRNFPWEIFYTWSVTHRALFTPIAFSMFITKGVVPRAREASATWRQLLHLLSAALLLGSFSFRTVFFFGASSFFSRDFKRKAREFISPKARRARRLARSAESTDESV